MRQVGGALIQVHVYIYMQYVGKGRQHADAALQLLWIMFIYFLFIYFFIYTYFCC